MNNLFSIDNYPTTEPEELISGKRWSWLKDDISDTYPVAEFTLQYRFSDLSNGNSRVISADKLDERHVVQVPSSKTADFDGVEYLVVTEIVRDSDSECIAIDERFINVRKDDTGYKSHIYKVLMAVRALIEGKATKDHQATTINGRSLARFTPEDWMKLEIEYAGKWARERKKLNATQGRLANKRTLIRMKA